MNTIMELLTQWDERAKRYRKNVKRYEDSKQVFEAEFTAGLESELRRCGRELRRIISFTPRGEDK